MVTKEVESMLRNYVTGEMPAQTKTKFQAAQTNSRQSTLQLKEVKRTKTNPGIGKIAAPLKLQQINQSTKPDVDEAVGKAIGVASQGTEIVSVKLPTKEDAEYALVVAMRGLAHIGMLDLYACRAYGDRKLNRIPPIALTNGCHIVISVRG